MNTKVGTISTRARLWMSFYAKEVVPQKEKNTKKNTRFHKINTTLFPFRKHFLSKERTCAKKDYSFGKAFL